MALALSSGLPCTSSEAFIDDHAYPVKKVDMYVISIANIPLSCGGYTYCHRPIQRKLKSYIRKSCHTYIVDSNNVLAGVPEEYK